MSEIKYGNMPASAVEEIREAFKQENGADSFAYLTFCATAIPVLARLWPEDRNIEELQSAKDKEIRKLRAELEEAKKSQTAEDLRIAGSDTAQCQPDDIAQQLIDVFKVQKLLKSNKTDEDMRTYIKEARRVLELSIADAAQKLAPPGIPQGVAEYNIRLLENSPWRFLDCVGNVLAFDVYLKYQHMLDKKVEELLEKL